MFCIFFTVSDDLNSSSVINIDTVYMIDDEEPPIEQKVNVAVAVAPEHVKNENKMDEKGIGKSHVISSISDLSYFN